MEIEKLIDEDLFYHHYQPIYDLKSGGIVAFEALLRPLYFSNPEEMFLAAIEEKKLYELDSRSIHKAIQTYNDAGFTEKEGVLFINVYPSTIMNERFPSFITTIMNEKSTKNQLIVLEVNEKESIENIKTLRDKLLQLKELGILYAIDDLGRGLNDMEKLLELDTDYIKLDRFITKNLNESKKKQEVIKEMVHFCNRFDIRLVVEGLESSSDIFICKHLGVHMGQGYKLRKPGLLKK